MHHFSSGKRGFAFGAASALLATAALISVPTAASAEPAFSASCAGVPADQISIQIYSYSSWIDEIGLDAVLGQVAAAGVTHVELDGLRGLTAAQYRDLLDKHGLTASGSHGTADSAAFDQAIADALELGQPYIGAAFFPGPGLPPPFPAPPATPPTYADLLTTADLMDDLGVRSVDAGVGKFFAHNHFWEFDNEYPDPVTGEMKTGWQVVVENTNPQYVTFEIDVFWATAAGQDVPGLLERYGDRVSLLHMKDGVPGTDFPADWRDGGEGIIDWPAILEAAEGNVDYYVLERDSAPASPEFVGDSFSFFTCAELGDPAVTIAPASLTAGSKLTATASGFTGGRAYALFLPGGQEPLGTATADEDGAFTIDGTLPKDLAGGSYALEIRGLLGGAAATATIVIPQTAGDPAAKKLAATGSESEPLVPITAAALLLLGAGAAFATSAKRRSRKAN